VSQPPAVAAGEGVFHVQLPAQFLMLLLIVLPVMHGVVLILGVMKLMTEKPDKEGFPDSYPQANAFFLFLSSSCMEDGENETHVFI
jgi:hypothetical protein